MQVLVFVYSTIVHDDADIIIGLQCRELATRLQSDMN